MHQHRLPPRRPDSKEDLARISFGCFGLAAVLGIGGVWAINDPQGQRAFLDRVWAEFGSSDELRVQPSENGSEVIILQNQHGETIEVSVPRKELESGNIPPGLEELKWEDARIKATGRKLGSDAISPEE